MISALLVGIGLLLVVLNGFFVAAEFGMVKLRHTQIEQIKNIYGLRGKILAEIHQQLDVYLSACQLGITLASLGLGWIGEPAFASLLAPVLIAVGIFSTEWIHIIAFFIAFFFLSFLHIVVGELMPKSLALRQAERVSLWTAMFLYGFYWLMYPVIWLLNACSLFLLKALQLDSVQPGDQSYSTGEIKLILSTSHLHGDLTKEEVDILEHTLDLADLKVSEIMRPIKEMTALNESKPFAESLDIILKTRYSRYPVYQHSLNHITGIIHIKNLLAECFEHKNTIDIKNLVRPILKVDQDLPALDLLNKFRGGMPHFAVILNQTATPIGFITLDNLLHILFGKIRDEFHKTKDDWLVLPDGGLLMNGNCSLYTVERALDIDILPNNETITTLSDLLLQQAQAVPKTGARIEFPQFSAIIDQAKGPRVLKVRLYKKLPLHS